jgi:hypothetical protein
MKGNEKKLKFAELTENDFFFERGQEDEMWRLQ